MWLGWISHIVGTHQIISNHFFENDCKFGTLDELTLCSMLKMNAM